jgi:hypothetical protein
MYQRLITQRKQAMQRRHIGLAQPGFKNSAI